MFQIIDNNELMIKKRELKTFYISSVRQNKYISKDTGMVNYLTKTIHVLDNIGYG